VTELQRTPDVVKQLLVKNRTSPLFNDQRRQLDTLLIVAGKYIHIVFSFG